MKIDFKQILEWRKEKLKKDYLSIKNHIKDIPQRRRQHALIKIKTRITEISYLIKKWNKRIKQ